MSEGKAEYKADIKKLLRKNKGQKPRVISLVNQKGGVGKTTSTKNIGAGLTGLGYAVLLIDLDPQASLTYSLGIQAHELSRTVYEVLKGDIKPEEIIIEKYGLHLIPSSLNLSGAEIELSGIAGRELLLKEALENITKDYDYIFIDCPPSLNLLTLNALTVAEEVFVPLQTEFLAMQGLTKLIDTVNIVKKRFNKGLDITGIIGTRFDSRKNLNKEVIEKIKEYFKDKLFDTLIRDNIALAEAPGFGQDIFTYRKDSYGAEDYLALCREIVRKGDKK
ncbi:MAG: Sporulation initiation inhibitor protein Soj [Firmicutes bacterium ADurb.Bin099]|nr:MAG: Sporulation initiation inhibitor protein Soj [Firmicutes bacterium ADurb.Bin099]